MTTTLEEKIDLMIGRMVTKEDLKEALGGFATKEDLKGFATKDDLKGFATNEGLGNLEHEVKKISADLASFRKEVGEGFRDVRGDIDDLAAFTAREFIAVRRELREEMTVTSG